MNEVYRENFSTYLNKSKQQQMKLITNYSEHQPEICDSTKGVGVPNCLTRGAGAVCRTKECMRLIFEHGAAHNLLRRSQARRKKPDNN